MNLEKRALDRILEGRIVPWADYGEHIALTCKDHPEARFDTKNIEFIGARAIFGYNRDCEYYDCPTKNLVPLPPKDPNWKKKAYMNFWLLKTSQIKNKKAINRRKAELGIESTLKWIMAQRKLTGKSLGELADEARSLGIY